MELEKEMNGTKLRGEFAIKQEEHQSFILPKMQQHRPEDVPRTTTVTIEHISIPAVDFDNPTKHYTFNYVIRKKKDCVNCSRYFTKGWKEFVDDRRLNMNSRVKLSWTPEEYLLRVSVISKQPEQQSTASIDVAASGASSSSGPETRAKKRLKQSEDIAAEALIVMERGNADESVKMDNGRSSVHVLDEQSLSKFLHSKRLENSVNRSNTRLKLFSGLANPALAKEIAWYMGLELGKVKVKRFADGEIYVQLEESVRGCDVYIVQPTCPPANENLMDLLIMIDACRRASARNINAVIPYFGYARADRKTQGRESIAAKLVANLITEAGAYRVLACDLLSGQSMGYFDIPVDHVYCQPVILDYLASKGIALSDLVVVSPDVGGVARARAFDKKLSDAPLAIVDKRRHAHNVAEVMNLIGDVRGKVAVMVDDMIDTAGTITKGAELLHEVGAREVYACCTHAVFRLVLSSSLDWQRILIKLIELAEDTNI